MSNIKVEYPEHPEYIVVNERDSRIIFSSRVWDEFVATLVLLDKADAEYQAFIELKT